MGAEVVYEIARYGVDTDVEVLIERAQVLSRGHALWRRVGDGPETPCLQTDVAAAIGADPLLNEVRANQITRITAKSEVRHDLPFVLRVPGDRTDFDESLWSQTMQNHCGFDGYPERGMYRLLYVNGAHWGAWPTPEGQRMLPEEQPYPSSWAPHLTSCWATLDVEGGGAMSWSADKTAIGLVTPSVVAWATEIADEQEQDVVLRPRGDDAAVFIEWLLDGRGNDYWQGYGDYRLQVQLFVETSTNQHDGEFIPSHFLVAGTDMYERASSRDGSGSDWKLDLHLEPAMIDAVLDLLAQRDPRFSDIVTAARNPRSPAGRARRTALKRWEQNHQDWR